MFVMRCGPAFVSIPVVKSAKFMKKFDP